MSEPLRITPLGARNRLIFWSSDSPSVLPGFQLPQKIGDTVQHGDTTALRLGPQECILFLSTAEKARLDAIIAIDTLVDVSHRFDGLRLNGVDSLTALHMGCPHNLAELAIHKGVRTLFDKIEIIVLRTGEHEYRVEFGRSYADYMTTRLQDGAREIMAEANR